MSVKMTRKEACASRLRMHQTVPERVKKLIQNKIATTYQNEFMGYGTAVNYMVIRGILKELISEINFIEKQKGGNL